MSYESEVREWRLQQFLVHKGGWAAVFYALTHEERDDLFTRLQEEIMWWEKEQDVDY